jgi:hypothetical protein
MVMLGVMIRNPRLNRLLVGERTALTAMKDLTAFSWCYWGWGNHTPDFVRAIDDIERARGKQPPFFADIRFSRSVRAQGFRDAVFVDTVGKNKYRWLRKTPRQLRARCRRSSRSKGRSYHETH